MATTILTDFDKLLQALLSQDRTAVERALFVMQVNVKHQHPLPAGVELLGAMSKYSLSRTARDAIREKPSQ